LVFSIEFPKRLFNKLIEQSIVNPNLRKQIKSSKHFHDTSEPGNADDKWNKLREFPLTKHQKIEKQL